MNGRYLETLLLVRDLLVNVTGSLQNIVQGHNSSVQFGHVLFDDEVLSPCIQDVGLQG